MRSCNTGDLVRVVFENREFDVIVIDPNGFGKDKPSLGLGFRMADKYLGIPRSTFSGWVVENNGVTRLKLPSGNVLRVVVFSGNDKENYKILEISDWVSLAIDILVVGKAKKENRQKIGDFLSWFAAKGIYASAYAELFGSYTKSDDTALTAELNEARGIITAQQEEIKQLNKAVRGLTNVASNIAEQMQASKKPIVWKNGMDMIRLLQAQDYAKGEAAKPPKWE